ncbi:MAG: hypothetical protein WD266_09195 [Balneolales bacterium]
MAMHTVDKGRKNPLTRELNIIYYIDNMGNTLMGWQPRVILLNRFVHHLVEELNDIPDVCTLPGHAVNIELIKKLANRDIDYVTDCEYINCIKLILEIWHPGLMSKKYIRYAYEGLAIGKEKFENDAGYYIEEAHKEYQGI